MTVLAAVLAFLGFAALIVLHEAGHFAAAKAVGMRVERFSLFFGKPFVSFRRGETEYGIGPIPLGGYVKITGMNPAEAIPPEVAHRAYFRQPVWKRVVVIAAGPAVNVVLAFLILWGFYTFAGVDESSRRIDAVEPRSPAAAVLRSGDEVVAVDGRRGDARVISDQIASHRCAEVPPVNGCRAEEPARVTVRRDGVLTTVPITPVYDPELRRTRVGFGYEQIRVPQPAGEAAGTSADVMWGVTTATVDVIGRLFYDAEARRQLSGVVGSYEATRRTIEFDAERAVAILGLISLSLAIVNLLPILPLDGGHVLWAVAEKLRGRAVPYRIMERASLVGIVLILIVFAIGLNNDIGRLVSGELERSLR